MLFNYYFSMLCLFVYVAGWTVSSYARWTKTGQAKAVSAKSRLLTIVGGFGCFIIGIQGGNLALPLIHLPPPVAATVLGCILLVAGTGLSLWGSFQYHAVFSVSEHQRGGEIRPRMPYTRMRQPFYTGLIMALPGLLLLVSTLYILVLSIFLIVVLGMKAFADDAFLRDRLGEDYAAYSKQVPLLLPSLSSLKND